MDSKLLIYRNITAEPLWYLYGNVKLKYQNWIRTVLLTFIHSKNSHFEGDCTAICYHCLYLVSFTIKGEIIMSNQQNS